MRHMALASVVVVLFAAAGFAQTATVTKTAPIYLQQNPPDSLLPMRVAAVGTVLRVVGQDGEWLQVQFQDPDLGLRTGWVKSEFVTVRRPELEPIDLSIKPQQLPTGATPPRSDQSQPAPRATGPRTERGWFDVDIGLGVSGADDQTLGYYGLGAEFDFGGGVMIAPFLGAGVSLTGTAYLADTVHPADHEAYYDVWRTEGALNIQAMTVPLNRENLRVRIFGGPTYFRLRERTYNHVDGTGWGFHVGGDFSYFFTPVVGVGGLIRYSYGKVTVSDLAGDFTVGGFQTGGGLRLRF